MSIGPVALYSADALAPWLADAATVTTWPNSVYGFENLEGVVAPVFRTNILNGKPVIRFNGTTQWLRATNVRAQSIFANRELTIIALAKPTVANARLSLCGKVLSSNFEYRCNIPSAALGSFTAYQASGTVNAACGNYASNPTAGEWVVSAFRARRGLELAAWRAGGLTNPKLAAVTFTGAQIFGTAPFAVGQRGNGTAADFFEGDLAELVVYPRALSVLEIDEVHKEFGRKYNLPPFVSYAGP